MENVTNSAGPSIIRFNAGDQDYVDRANVLVAPLVMGAFADMFLQGILVVQTTNYFSFREVDGPQHRFKWLVIVLCLLCGLKSVQNIVIVWNATIATYGYPAASSAMIFSWVFYTTGLSTAIIATISQAFFAYRYWMLTKRWYICVIMVLGMAVSLFGAALVPVSAARADAVSASKWSLVHFVAAIIVDGLITIGTAIYLHSRKPGVQSTSDIIDRLVRTTWQSALPPAVCVSINAVLTEAYKTELTQIALNMVLPKLYAISLMYTLNMRNELRGSRGSEPSNNGQITLGAKQPSGPPEGFDRLPRSSVVAIDAGNGTRDDKRGVKFLGGHSLNFSRRLDPTGRRVDGIHVETHTHVGTDIGGNSRNNIQMQSFQGDEQKEDRRDSEGDSDVWIRKL